MNTQPGSIHDTTALVEGVEGMSISNMTQNGQQGKRSPKHKKTGHDKRGQAAGQRNSLHVADLDNRVDENYLQTKLFNVPGAPVVSCKVVRDKATGRSLSYAYVNFENEQQAKLALDAVNSKKAYGKAVRVSFTRPRNTYKNNRNNQANLYVKNLHPSIGTKDLYDHFNPCGSITSCRVMEYPDGTSKGFGFVAYQLREEAAAAIEKLNNSEWQGKIIHVSHARQRRSRPHSHGYRNSQQSYGFTSGQHPSPYMMGPQYAQYPTEYQGGNGGTMYHAQMAPYYQYPMTPQQWAQYYAQSQEYSQMGVQFPPAVPVEVAAAAAAAHAYAPGHLPPQDISYQVDQYGQPVVYQPVDTQLVENDPAIVAVSEQP